MKINKKIIAYHSREGRDIVLFNWCMDSIHMDKQLIISRYQPPRRLELPSQVISEIGPLSRRIINMEQPVVVPRLIKKLIEISDFDYRNEKIINILIVMGGSLAVNGLIDKFKISTAPRVFSQITRALVAIDSGSAAICPLMDIFKNRGNTLYRRKEALKILVEIVKRGKNSKVDLILIDYLQKEEKSGRLVDYLEEEMMGELVFSLFYLLANRKGGEKRRGDAKRKYDAKRKAVLNILIPYLFQKDVIPEKYHSKLRCSFLHLSGPEVARVIKEAIDKGKLDLVEQKAVLELLNIGRQTDGEIRNVIAQLGNRDAFGVLFTLELASQNRYIKVRRAVVEELCKKKDVVSLQNVLWRCRLGQKEVISIFQTLVSIALGSDMQIKRQIISHLYSFIHNRCDLNEIIKEEMLNARLDVLCLPPKQLIRHGEKKGAGYIFEINNGSRLDKKLYIRRLLREEGGSSVLIKILSSPLFMGNLYKLSDVIKEIGEIRRDRGFSREIRKIRGESIEKVSKTRDEERSSALDVLIGIWVNDIGMKGIVRVIRERDAAGGWGREIEVLLRDVVGDAIVNIGEIAIPSLHQLSRRGKGRGARELLQRILDNRRAEIQEDLKIEEPPKKRRKIIR